MVRVRVRDEQKCRFLTRTYLTHLARLLHMDLPSVRNQVCTKNSQIFSTKNNYDIFLSHSYLDKSLVYTIVDQFNDEGYCVYVDWMVDTQLDRNEITATTARILRKQMNLCRGLVYVSTTNISNSKWCPWELGYMDGKKDSRCAILPILDSPRGKFIGQEYLGIYPYVKYKKVIGDAKTRFLLYDPIYKNRYVELNNWLTGRDPYKHE